MGTRTAGPSDWSPAVRTAVDGIEAPPGSLVVVRDTAGRPQVLHPLCAELGRRGITAVVDLLPPDVLCAVLSGDPADLAHFGGPRAALLEHAHAVLSLGAAPPELGSAPPAAVDAFRAGRAAMAAVEARRRLPVVVLAVPTGELAAAVGIPLAALDAAVTPALAVPRAVLAGRVAAALARVGERRAVVLDTPAGRLVADRGSRAWLSDDGHVSPADRAAGAVVSNLPAGSVYTTVEETSVRGRVALSALGSAEQVVLTFAAGRVVDVSAVRGARALRHELSRHGGDADRLSHLGVGLNPGVGGAPTGWVLLEEHRAGAVFLALGDNAYLGGANTSTYNRDALAVEPDLSLGGRALVAGGRLVV